MEAERVLHVNGGDGVASYAQNSLLQKKVLIMTKLIKEDAIRGIHRSFNTVRSLAIADLGCSSGPNTLFTIHELVTAISKVRQELENLSPINIEIFLNDLTGNDFNSIFVALPSLKKQLKNEMGEGLEGCFVHATPGSFYERLFKAQSLHLIHSSYALQWLSEVPKDVGRSNKSNVISSSDSSIGVIEAYYKQFQTGFTTFLRCRSEELVMGGCMIFTLLGRSNDPSIKGSGYILELLGLTLKQMVSEGLIQEEMLDIFNVPFYAPSPNEIESEVKNQGSFGINELQVSEVEWGVAAPSVADGGAEVGQVTRMMRAVAEPVLADHFGQGLMDKVFKRYEEVLGDCMTKERTFFTNITASLTKLQL